ncbi:MAG: hypothetical protein HQL51_03160 [Magnetococcales bacterium]|nr:hypothetical protein [Magnetococcales bacterium]
MIKIRLKELVQRPPQDHSSSCRQNCDLCRDPCAKQGRYSKSGLTSGHLEIGRAMDSPLQAPSPPSEKKSPSQE